MYLANTALVIGMVPGIEGFKPVPDGLVRLQGLRLASP
jgi:hypothetical protein